MLKRFLKNNILGAILTILLLPGIALAATLIVPQGGTGISSCGIGALLYGNGSNPFTCLTLGSSGQVLTVSGGLPVWSTPTAGGTGSIGTTTTPVVGNLAFWDGLKSIGSVATGTLTETITGVDLSAVQGLVGGSAILSLTAGYGIPLTASTTAWNSFYTTPSSRITAGTNLSWSGNTLNATGGGAGTSTTGTTTWSSTIQAWIYPDTPFCLGDDEATDGRQIHTLKPEYIALNNDGTYRLDTVASSSCNAYTAANAQQIASTSREQFITVSGNATGFAALMASGALQSAFIASSVNLATTTGFTGIELDIEGYGTWTQSDTDKFYLFVDEFAKTLHFNGKKLMIDLPPIWNSAANTDSGTGDEWDSANSTGYYKLTYQQIARTQADYLVIMGYDYHFDYGGGSSIQPLKWVGDIVAFAKKKIVDIDRIVIGMPSYGYYATTGGYDINNLTYNQMIARTGSSTATRDPLSGEMKWVNGTSSNVYVDRIGMDYKRDYIERLGIKHISVWHLGGNQWFTAPSAGGKFELGQLNTPLIPMWIASNTGATTTSLSYTFGNVGIGTTTPTQILSIMGNLRLTGAIFDSNNSAGTSGMVLQSTAVGTQWVATSSLGITGGGAASGTVNTGNTGNVGYYAATGTAISANSNINIDSTGRVGIGTAAPSVALELVRSDTNTVVTTGNATAIRLTNTATTTDNMSEVAFTTNDTAGTNLRTSAITGVNSSHTVGAMSGALAFLTRNAGTYAERMRLTAAGFLGIGTTTPGNALTVVGTTTSNNLIVDQITRLKSLFIGDTATTVGRWNVATSTLTPAALLVTNSGYPSVIIGADDSTPIANFEINSQSQGAYTSFGLKNDSAKAIIGLDNTNSLQGISPNVLVQNISGGGAGVMIPMSSGNASAVLRTYNGLGGLFNVYVPYNAAGTESNVSTTMGEAGGCSNTLDTGLEDYPGTFPTGNQMYMHSLSSSLGCAFPTMTFGFWNQGNGDTSNATSSTGWMAASTSDNTKDATSVVVIGDAWNRGYAKGAGSIDYGMRGVADNTGATVQLVSSSSRIKALEVFNRNGNTFNPLLTVANAGYVGIGTTTPNQTLDVVGSYPTARITNYTGSQYAGSRFWLGNTANTLGNQAGTVMYSGINDAGITQGYFSIEQSNVAGTGIAKLLLADYNAQTMDLYASGTSRLTLSRLGASTTDLVATRATTSVLKIAALRDSANSFGTVGQVLQSNGTTAQWVATSSLGIVGGSAGTGTSQWTTTGSDIYYATGNVAVGTTTAPTKMWVEGSAPGNGYLESVIRNSTSTGRAELALSAGASQPYYSGFVTMSGNDVTNYPNTMEIGCGFVGCGLNLWSDGFLQGRMGTNGNVAFGSTTGLTSKLLLQGTVAGQTLLTVASTTGATLFNILGNGNVGIGTSTPQSTLSIIPAAGVAPLTVSSSTNTGLVTFGIDNQGLALFGTSTAAIENTRKSMVTFVSNSGDDGYVTFKNPTAGKAQSMRIRANSLFAHIDIVSSATSWLLGNFGSNDFSIWDDTGSGVPVITVKNGSTANRLTIDANGLIGISSTTPTSMLDIKVATGTNPFNIASSSGAALLTLTSAGFLGVGTSAPGSMLTVTGSSSFATTTAASSTIGALNVTGLSTLSGAATVIGLLSATSPAFTTSITTPSTSFTLLAGATTLLTIGGTGASASNFFQSTLDTTTSITGAIRTSGGISAAKSLIIGTTASIGTSTKAAMFNVQATAGLPALNVASSTGASMLFLNVNGLLGIGTTTSSIISGLALGATGAISFGDNTVASSSGIAIFEDQKAQGTNGGTSTAGLNIRVLNTTVANTIPGASLASNQVTLPAGTYDVQACAVNWIGNKTKLAWFNTTDSATTTNGLSQYSDVAGTDPGTVQTCLSGYFVITASKVFELRHYIQQARNANGLGVNAGFGTETYANVTIHKR